ncbi:hypothetical protein [Aquibacillus albus]|uniref:Uncharacterized protein (UPF0335 family) n=1 Tax=Aquibacillus albus TaxID=1168171 RepID=A0ABS2N452_9BACI|nr:hypothetical protein [Aquibacillus albus]MBM7572921.1 uncharacterized protein (UPF0335 family) [Aquibacillus albus]
MEDGLNGKNIESNYGKVRNYETRMESLEQEQQGIKLDVKQINNKLDLLTKQTSNSIDTDNNDTQNHIDFLEH